MTALQVIMERIEGHQPKDAWGDVESLALIPEPGAHFILTRGSARLRSGIRLVLRSGGLVVT